jgi:hypothetical protein
MNRQRIAHFMLILSFGYWLVVICSVMANVIYVPSFGQAKAAGTLSHGCYLTDTMLIYVKCVDFPGASFSGFVLSLPWNILQVLAFLFSPYFFIGVPATLLFWGPLVYPFIYRWRRGRNNLTRGN